LSNSLHYRSISIIYLYRTQYYLSDAYKAITTHLNIKSIITASYIYNIFDMLFGISDAVLLTKANNFKRVK